MLGASPQGCWDRDEEQSVVWSVRQIPPFPSRGVQARSSSWTRMGVTLEQCRKHPGCGIPALPVMGAMESGGKAVMHRGTGHSPWEPQNIQ